MFNKNQSYIDPIKAHTSETFRAADKLVRLKRYDEAMQKLRGI